MEFLQSIVHWAYGFFYSGAEIANLFSKPLLGSLNLLSLLTIGGLTTYLMIAIVKWTLD